MERNLGIGWRCHCKPIISFYRFISMVIWNAMLKFSRMKQMQKINKEVEDTSLAIFEYNHEKKLGLIEATNTIRPKKFRGSISIIGEKGTAIVGGIAGEQLIEWTMNKNKKINKLLKTKSKKKNGHVKFYDYIMKNYHKKSNFLTLEEGMKSLKIVNSIYSLPQNTPFLINKVRDTFLGNKKNLMKIDFNNIYRQDKVLFNKIIRDIKKIIKKSNFILGDEVKKI